MAFSLFKNREKEKAANFFAEREAEVEPPDPLNEEEWEKLVEASSVDPKVWTGAFKTNVWGGRYDIDGILGKGAQGATFVGTDRRTGTRVAIKLCDLSKASSWKEIELFDRQIKTLKYLEHKHIPKFLDVLEDEETGARALVMTLMQGDNFEEVLKNEGRQPEAELWRVLESVGSVLAMLHGQAVPVLHRDIKPANLICEPDGDISVVDFGGVGYQSSKKASTVVGTFGYMAPELMYGESAPHTDVFALGATIMTLATGKEPEDLPRKGLSIDVDKSAPHLSPNLRALLQQMVEPEPEKRPKNGRVLVRAIEKATAAPQNRQTRREQKSQTKREKRQEWRRERKHRKRRRHDPDHSARVLGGFLSFIVGLLGTVAAVIIGEVFAPIFSGIVKNFVGNKDTEKKLLHAAEMVQQGAASAKDGFSVTMERGVEMLDGNAEAWKEETSDKIYKSTVGGGKEPDQVIDPDDD